MFLIRCAPKGYAQGWFQTVSSFPQECICDVFTSSTHARLALSKTPPLLTSCGRLAEPLLATLTVFWLAWISFILRHNKIRTLWDLWRIWTGKPTKLPTQFPFWFFSRENSLAGCMCASWFISWWWTNESPRVLHSNFHTRVEKSNTDTRAKTTIIQIQSQSQTPWHNYEF